jgi:hypothetical protein
VHGPIADVEVLFSEVFERRRGLVPNGVPDCAGDANSSRFGQRRNAYGYFAPLTIDLGARFDQIRELVNRQRSNSAAYQIVASRGHLTDIDADAERYASVWRCADIAIKHAPLYLDGTPYRLGRAGELHEQTAAGRPRDATVMLRNLVIYELLAMSLQPFESTFLVCFDQAWVAHHISGEYYDKTADSSHYRTTPP